ncbi:hypothetical protein GCK72_024366 [Caenorhabditis remanei]|uniref:Uncharacterized protein n=1 Tax=Caenorhabditis remanei TaxID=31234 RepID=A0A6A5FYX9_CAERE|nr:hypothetical protein GCK72_024366 [Caenorhabditis remanei]KAF1747900.1 hypothetical protein GCK72_024366 [Caenorhabditis remanei]
MPVRVRSTFELANPIRELPPDPDAVAISPNTRREREKAMDDLLKNAKCEEGTSMDSIATYIPSKATLKRREEEAARAQAAAEQADGKAISARKQTKIAELEAKIVNLKRDSFDENMIEGKAIEKLSITRPTSVFAQGEDGSQPSAPAGPPLQNRASLSSSDSITIVSSPTIGALVAAPPAMGALMGAPPGVGAMVVAALQPAQGSLMSSGDVDDISLSEDFQIVHDELKQAEAVDKSTKKRH